MGKTSLLSAAVLMATMQMGTAQAANSDQIGKCYGVVGKGQGECGGKNPANGESWSCAGHNPTADLGWKKITRGECEKMAKHPEATAKKFEAKKGQLETL
jgi:uncharacterized membrane protein